MLAQGGYARSLPVWHPPTYPALFLFAGYRLDHHSDGAEKEQNEAFSQLAQVLLLSNEFGFVD